MTRKFQYEQSPFKVDYSLPGLVRMNLNENLVLPAAFVRKALRECEREVDSRFYPSELKQGEMKELKALAGEYCGCKEWMVELGSGADQLIDLLCRMTLRSEGNQLVTVKPTFSMYSLRAGICGASTAEIPLGYAPLKEDPFPLDSKKVVKACASVKTKLLALASPNNPSGVQYEIELLKEILDGISSRVVVLLDEAYVEYARYSAAPLLRKYPQLMILRTFSKAFGLASHRIGYLISSNRSLIEKLEADYQYPFPLTSLGVRLAGKLLKQKDVILRYAEETKKHRKNLIDSLEDIGNGVFSVIPKSDANFILLESQASEKISKMLLAKYRIAVKYIPNMSSRRSFIRITVGTGQMNSKLLEALNAISRSL